ncbi:hypothetical protein ACS0TY_015207 [Phlomoides rotata]
MEDHYGMAADLRQYLGGRPLFPPPPDLLSTHRGFNPYDMLVFRSDSTASVTTANTNAGASCSAAALGGFDGALNGGGGGDGGTGRWPRQETLTLLEIRSRLDPKFKEANQKGPLWDEVSRIMSEEHGYQRSGKKCREKFENLYKYYKKTKEGKAGRQDGKHYRFFRQLEALCGENNTNNNNNPQPENNTSFYPNFKGQDTSLSLSNYSDADTTSSENCDSNRKTEWKLKIRDFIDMQMKKLMDKQEAWMEKMMRTIEQKERDRMSREEEWRKQEAARVDREHKFWADERAWIEARDAALMEALNKLTGKENDDVWPECEMNRLSCKDKWDSVNNYLLKCNKKRMKSSYYQSNESISNQGEGGVSYGDHGMRLNDHRNEENGNGNDAIAMTTDSCFRYFMGDGYGRINID